MAGLGLSPCLEGGRSLLSSPVDGSCRSNVCSHSNLESDQFASDIISSMEALARQLAFSILEDNHHHTIDNHRTDLPYIPSVNYQRCIHGYPWFCYQDIRVAGFAGKPVQNVSKPALSSTRFRPGQLHVKVVSGVGRQNRGLPFRVVGSGASGFIRESGGTGVFLPRVVRSMEAFCNLKPYIPGQLPAAQGAGTGAVGRHVVGPHSPQRSLQFVSPDVALPSEWTY